MAKKTSADYIPAVGRRKLAIARIRLFPEGSGTILVNGKEAANYFKSASLASFVGQPLSVLNMDGRYTITVKVIGGGLSGQAGAVRHGIARALVKVDEENRGALRQAGYLTRDPRVKERKKYGLKRARKAPQYTKR